MPLRAHPVQKESKTLLCINCPNTLLTVPPSRYTLQPDDSFATPQILSLFAAVCDTCGYTELYKEGPLFQGGRSEEGES
ncbi:hypothetical protein D7Y21_17875 [Corallococcus sp. AB045]|uniref:hypothetical protein n=1 Tax=unclassified Corallococcus TaxID=2685029 RepID=UPI000ECDE6F4|nr:MULTISPECIES: hypothetical protein [unclassified Corallococcus]RKH87762.1 hypothetical protein D7Y21_17875 [Corallococcus sp. AB045]